jgi:hypothetical protein
MIPYLDSPEDWWLSATQSIKEDERGKSQTSSIRELSLEQYVEHASSLNKYLVSQERYLCINFKIRINPNILK